MLDLAFVLDHPEEVRRAAAEKGFPADVETVRLTAIELRALARRLTELRRRIRELSRTRGASPLDRTLARHLRRDTAAVKRAHKEAEGRLRDLLLLLPNLPHPDAPRDAGPEPDHVAGGGETGETAPAGGVGAVIWRGARARAEETLVRRLLDGFTERGYSPVVGGPLVTRRALVWAGFFPRWETSLEAVRGDLHPAPRPEALLVSLHAGERLPSARLPLAYTAAGWCLRPRGASRGRAGLRPSQYRAVEAFRIEEPSPEALQRLIDDVEGVLGSVKVRPSRVERTVARLSFSASRSVDLLAAGPGGGPVRLCTVTSYGDFLGRRAGTRIAGKGFAELLSAAVHVPGLLAVTAVRPE